MGHTAQAVEKLFAAREVRLERDIEIEQGTILLASKDIRLPRATCRPIPRDRKLEGICRFNHKEVRDTLDGDAVECRDGFPSHNAAMLDAFKRMAIVENNVKRDVVYTGILAPDGFGKLA